MNLEKIIESSEFNSIKAKYLYWNNFMHDKVEFNLGDSLIHSTEHTSRVLLFALLLADHYQLNPEDTDILAMAAVFHDTRRINDYRDTGHGERAAAYYATYCVNSGLPYEKLTYLIISYHDRDDDLGISMIAEQFPNHEKAIFLYKIFKDSDGLDRLRLGSKWLDLNRLRTDYALKLLPLAKRLNGFTNA